MKLDNKVKEDYIIFSCFGTEQAKQYVDTKGYFTNDIGDFSNLDDCYYGTLNVVDNNSSRSYLNKDVPLYFNFFLPEEFVKEKQVKKKYRPYTIEEFCNEGFEILVFREKANPLMEYHVRYNGYRKYDNVYNVILGNIAYTFNDLFTDYEYLDEDGNWKPFGVEE